MARVHHLRHVLVTLRRLLHHQLGRRHANRDPFRLELLQHLGVIQLVTRVVSASSSTRAVTRASERLRHALLRARQDVRARPHRTPDQHRLSGVLVVHRDERVVRRERASRSLAMHQQRF